MLNHRKSRHHRTSESRLLYTLEPKGMEFGCLGFDNRATNGHRIPGSQMAPKVSRSICGVKPGKPNASPAMGRSSARSDEGAVGRGNGKKRKATCNELHRGLLNLKRC